MIEDNNYKITLYFILISLLIILISGGLISTVDTTQNYIDINTVDYEPSSSDSDVIKYSDLSSEEQQIFRKISINSNTHTGEFQDVDYISLDGEYYSISQNQRSTPISILLHSILIIFLAVFSISFSYGISNLLIKYNRAMKIIMSVIILICCIYSIYYLYPIGSDGIVISSEPIITESEEINYIHINDISKSEQIYIYKILLKEENRYVKIERYMNLYISIYWVKNH